jgi:hypothetical protein
MLGLVVGEGSRCREAKADREQNSERGAFKGDLHNRKTATLTEARNDNLGWRLPTDCTRNGACRIQVVGISFENLCLLEPCESQQRLDAQEVDVPAPCPRLVFYALHGRQHHRSSSTSPCRSRLARIPRNRPQHALER